MTAGILTETAVSPRLWQEAKHLRCRFPVPTELAVPTLRLRPTGQILGERINDLSPLPPENLFRQKLLGYANQWVRRMATTRERYRLKTNEADMEVWGPRQAYEPETDGAKAFAQNEWLNEEYIDFFLIADWIAEYGFLVPDITPEETHDLKVVTVKEWQAAEEAATLKLYGRRR